MPFVRIQRDRACTVKRCVPGPLLLISLPHTAYYASGVRRCPACFRQAGPFRAYPVQISGKTDSIICFSCRPVRAKYQLFPTACTVKISAFSDRLYQQNISFFRQAVPAKYQLFPIPDASDFLAFLRSKCGQTGRKKPAKPCVSRLCGQIALTPTRSRQLYSKRICLWDLAQSVCIVFII